MAVKIKIESVPPPAGQNPVHGPALPDPFRDKKPDAQVAPRQRPLIPDPSGGYDLDALSGYGPHPDGNDSQFVEVQSVYPLASLVRLEAIYRDTCPGADVLIRGCTPPRTLPHVGEFKTGPMDQETALVVGGLLVLPLLVEAAGVTLVASGIAESVATALSWGRVFVAAF